MLYRVHDDNIVASYVRTFQELSMVTKREFGTSVYMILYRLRYRYT